MEVFETAKTSAPLKTNIIAFFKKPKNLILVIIAVIITIVLACVITNTIRNGIITKQVQSYFDGKTFIAEKETSISAYTFKGNTIAHETLWTSDKSSSGNIEKRTPYKVKRDSDSKEFQLWFTEAESGRWVYGPSVSLEENGSYTLNSVIGEPYTETTLDYVTDIRTQILCEHEFGEETILKKATCSEEGEIKHTCELCGYTENQPTSKLDHNYINKICTECGTEKQPERAYNVKPNTWYVRNNVLFFQNCKVVSASTGTTRIIVSFKAVCQNCHAVSDMPRPAVPEINYPISKIHTCEYCGSSTIVKFRIGEPY